MMSVNTALVRFTYPRRQLGRGIAMTAVAVSVSSAAGPSVASAILAVASWPWLFAINVPIGLVTFLLSLRFLPLNPPSEHRFDMASAVLSALSFALLIAGINGIGHGQAAKFVVIELIGAILIGIILVRRQASLSLPLLPVDLFRRPLFALSVSASVCTFVAQGIIFVTLPFYFQDVLGRSQVATGLLMTPWPVMVTIIAPIAGRLADRYSAGILGGIGLSVLTVGFVLLATLPSHPSALDIVWRIVICGLGFGFFQSPNNRAIIVSAPRERSGSAGAIQSTARLLGQTIGAALVSLIFGLAGPSGGTSPAVAILLAAGFRQQLRSPASLGYSISCACRELRGLLRRRLRGTRRLCDHNARSEFGPSRRKSCARNFIRYAATVRDGGCTGHRMSRIGRGSSGF
jgi:DHA2 family multidrug resistance protein-like MFS transporter